MNLYEIIRDENELNSFLDLLNENGTDERYLLFLFARKKYNYVEGLTADKCQLKRILCHKKDIKLELQKLEIRQGLYRFGDLIMPQENLVVYIQPNMRSLKKATKQSITEGIDSLLENGNLNLKSIFYNNCQKFSVQKKYYILDIDFDRPMDHYSVKDQIQAITGEACHFIVTKNGMHGLLDLAKIEPEFKNTWYNQLSKTKFDGFQITLAADNACAIPGCIQSTHTPYILK